MEMEPSGRRVRRRYESPRLERSEDETGRSLRLFLVAKSELRKRFDSRILKALRPLAGVRHFGLRRYLRNASGKSLDDIIDDSAKGIWQSFIQDPGLYHQIDLIDEYGIDIENELCLFCEEMIKEMLELLGSLPKTKQRRSRYQILKLRTFKRNIRRYRQDNTSLYLEEYRTRYSRRKRGEWLETQSREEKVQGNTSTLHEEEAVVDRGKFSMETEEKEQEGSGKVEVQGQAVVSGGKISPETGETEQEESSFADYRRGWENLMGQGNSFENSTLLSPMLFTPCTPGRISMDATVGRTFQVHSVKIAELKGHQWPLKVYGVVAARDEVDKNRNPLFLCSRDDCQILDQEDPFLRLTGPCRAIVSEEPIEIEIQLRVKHEKKSDDMPLISRVFYYDGDYGHALHSSVIENHFCTVELSYQQLEESVQATIFGVHVQGFWAFPYGFRVACSSLPQGSIEDGDESKHSQVVLFDSKYGKMPMGVCGDLDLSRQVVSVELEGKLGVFIQAYGPYDGTDMHGSIFITPKECNTSQHTCYVGGYEVNMTVAWSLLVADETLIKMTGYVDPFVDLPPLHLSLLEKLGLSE